MPSLRHPATRVLASSLIVQAALVVSGPIAVRLLGVEGRGEAAFVYATVLLVSQVGPWGLPQAWAYFIARGDAHPHGLLKAYLPSYLVRTGLAALVGSVGLVLLASTDDSLSEPLVEGLIAAAGIASIMVAVLVLSSLQGSSRFTELAVLQAVPGLAYTAAIIVLAFVGHASIAVVLIANLAGWLVIGVIGLVRLSRTRPAAPSGAPSDPPTRRQLRVYGRRALVSATAPIDNLGIDQLAVGILLSHEALGLYVVGLAFETAPVLVLVALASVCTPTVAAITDPHARRRYCLRWLAIGAAIGLLAVAAIQAIIDPVLPLAFGREVEDAVPVARILVVAGLFLGLRRLAAGMLQGMGRPMASTGAETAGLVVMLAAVHPLGQEWGVEGACVALLLGGLVTFTLSAWLVLRRATPASSGSARPS